MNSLLFIAFKSINFSFFNEFCVFKSLKNAFTIDHFFVHSKKHVFLRFLGSKKTLFKLTTLKNTNFFDFLIILDFRSPTSPSLVATIFNTKPQKSLKICLLLPPKKKFRPILYLLTVSIADIKKK